MSPTLKTRGALALIVTDQIHAGCAMCTGEAVALVCFQLAERPLESGQADAGVVVLLVQADAVLRAKVIDAVINALLAVDARESPGTDAAGERGATERNRLLADVKGNNNKGRGFYWGWRTSQTGAGKLTYSR